VTDTSAKPHSAHRYRLRTFGTLALAGSEDDTLLGKHGQQRRTLALLAVLSAVGKRGRSRDQLLLLFWPDATQSRARHSLDQMLYAIRSSMDEAVFMGIDPVRLNREVVGSDVGDFHDALERGDLKGAAEQYRGPFLDGFYLSDAPEFQQWIDAERASLERTYSDVLERVAQSAEAAEDHATAVRWWRKLAETDPVSGKNATGLIRALMNAGDHAAALQYAEHYEAVVAQELGTSVGPAVTNLVAEIRAHTNTQPVTVSKSPRLASLPKSHAAPSQSATVDSSVAQASDSREETNAEGQTAATFEMPSAPVPAGATPVDQLQPQRSPRRRSAPYLMGGLVILVLIATALWLRATRADRTPQAVGEPSIAVLPFTNVSGDQQDAAFVDGLSEEMIAVLAKIGNLRVIARTSAFAFKNSNAGVRRIADSLGVSNLLEGSVQKVGPQLRIQVRLVDARDGSTRWSETYDREPKDIFSVQSEIAGAVARELDLRLGESALVRIKHGSTRNIAAYELYLRGNDPVLIRSDSGARAGLEYFRQAIALDQNYAAAYAGLARMHGRIASGGDTELPRRDRLALAEQAALKAVALDDSSGEAHAALSGVRRSNYEMASAESELMRAVALEPTNARFREWLVQLYVLTERPAEALVEARRALELDPLSPTANAELAHALLANDRCDEALAQLGKLKSLRPPLLRAGSIAAQCYARKQMWPEAIAEMQRISVNAGPRGQAHLGYMLARAGRTDEARRILAALLDRSRRVNGGAFDVATVYAGLGENDQAFKWLDKALDDRSLVFDYLQTVTDGLRGDPRFDGFRRRLGLQQR
jgi:TolB-like protein/DNA-binding SARP family transcriptional activator/tetratricopeptide (TPR) repeat protein